MDAPPTPAPAARLLDGGAELFPAMLDAIESARAAIVLEMYTFRLDRVGGRFVDALGRAARRGVSVRVTLDGWGSALDGRFVARELAAAGAQVAIHNPLFSLLVGRFRRNHRKVLVVDGAIAFLGGINLADEYAGDLGHAGWADLAVELRGPVCRDLALRLGGEPAPITRGPVTVLLSGLLTGRATGRALRKRYRATVAGARHRVLLAQGYFLPDAPLVRALVHAAKNGVEVTLLLAGRSDVPLARVAGRRLYRRLVAAGVHIHEWHGSILHAKAASVDGRLALIGSFNLDPLSLVNLEALVEVVDAAFAERVARWIAQHAAASAQITPADCERPPLQRWLGELFALAATRAYRGLARLLAWPG